MKGFGFVSAIASYVSNGFVRANLVEQTLQLPRVARDVVRELSSQTSAARLARSTFLS